MAEDNRQQNELFSAAEEVESPVAAGQVAEESPAESATATASAQAAEISFSDADTEAPGAVEPADADSATESAEVTEQESAPATAEAEASASATAATDGTAAATDNGAAEAAETQAAEETEAADKKQGEVGTVTEEEVRERLRGLEGKWYVLHTYSGYEKRVKQDLEARLVTMNMEDYIFQIEIPMEEVYEIKRGQRKLVQRVRMPGYVLIRMNLTNDSWRVVQATNGVTGFVGSGREPVALTFDETVNLLTPVVELEAAAEAKAAGAPTAEPETVAPFEIGDQVTLTTEPWAGMPATVSAVDPANQRLTVMMTLVGQETPVELAFTQVHKEE
ncbi:transcriptional antiterminator NusG [Actinobaculum suis]|uniref:Transcription termination/antitermination protein NusG n=1 Tax=Actinobaculum suis TaxID=1657 RepID=A0A1G7AYB4_9ACTO|nr:transcription termination/antitermination protein NusG [Actinobaculum suis]MDY5153488.1 transcription termination/antitermination protein NusG [Actinobaculum suis]SDE19577.1 transcriptional antiterminator NusG [Actinobaculum suis]